MQMRTNVYWQGHLENTDIEDGTVFYDIWELGVQHKVLQGSEDYFVCDTHQCYREQGKALHIKNVEDKSSNFTATIQFQLPPERVSGAMSINIWGQDQAHEPGVYDFMINLRLHYDENLQKIFVNHLPRKVKCYGLDCATEMLVLITFLLDACVHPVLFCGRGLSKRELLSKRQHQDPHPRSAQVVVAIIVLFESRTTYLLPWCSFYVPRRLWLLQRGLGLPR